MTVPASVTAQWFDGLTARQLGRSATRGVVRMKQRQAKGSSPWIEVTGDETIVLKAPTEEELQNRLLELLHSIASAGALWFRGSLDLAHDPDFAAWVAQRGFPLSDCDSELSWLDLGESMLWGNSAEEPATLVVDPSVGESTDRTVILSGRLYVAVKMPRAGRTMLWSPDMDTERTLLREHWDTGWGSGTRVLALRRDGLLEDGCYAGEGLAPYFRLLPSPCDDASLVRRVIDYNRTNFHEWRFDNGDLVDVTAYQDLFDRYVESGEAQEGSTTDNTPAQIWGQYHLTTSQRKIAREILDRPCTLQ